MNVIHLSSLTSANTNLEVAYSLDHYNPLFKRSHSFLILNFIKGADDLFTGVVQTIGQVTNVEKRRETIQLVIHTTEAQLLHYNVGDSMAVNGVCLTATKVGEDTFTADVMPETFRSTNLQYVRIGSSVNLERAMRATDRFEGHVVAGHVDSTVTVKRTWKDQNAYYMSFTLPKPYAQEVIAKGSITLDGTSLTVVEKSSHAFTISLIPHSQQASILSQRRVGDYVNMETDMLAKYILQANKQTLSQSFLQENGF